MSLSTEGPTISLEHTAPAPTEDPRAPHDSADGPSHRRLLLAVCLTGLTAPLTFTTLVVALPRMADDFGISVATASWILVIPMLVSSTLQTVGGRLGDLLGYRRVYLFSLLGFIAVSLAAAFAPSFVVLIALRVLQVTCGAGSSPNGNALIRLHLPPAQRAGAFGTMTAGMSLAMTVGPIIGGVLASVVSWRAIFLVPVPVAVVGFLLALRAIPLDPVPDTAHRRSFDLVGMVLLFASMLSLVLPLTLLRLGYLEVPWLAPVYLLLTGVVIAFVRWELRQPQPLLEPRLFLSRTYRAACTSDIFSNISQFPIAVVVSILVQTYLDYSASTAGIVIAVGSVTSIVFAPVGGRLADRFGRRLPAIAGKCFMVVGCLLLMLTSRDAGLPALIGAMAVMSIGGGLSFAAVQAAAIESAPRRYSGMASGVYMTTTFTGGIIGLTATSVYLAGEHLAARQFQIVFLVFALTAAISTLIATRIEPWPAAADEPALRKPAPQAP